MPALSIGECLSFGWETFKRRPGILIGAFLLVFIISIIPQLLFSPPVALPDQPPPPITTTDLIGLALALVVGILVFMAMVTFGLRAHDDIDRVTLADLWNPEPFLRFTGAYLLAVLVILIGLLLFIVPGLIASIGLAFATFLVIDRGAGPVNALKESWRITKGNKWRLFLLGLASVVINMVGALLLLVGLLVSFPVTWLAFVHAYRRLAAAAG